MTNAIETIVNDMKTGVLNLKALNDPAAQAIKDDVAIAFRPDKGWGRFAIDGVLQPSVMRVRCTNCDVVTTLHGSNVVGRAERFGGIVNMLTTFRGTCCGSRAVSVRSAGGAKVVAAVVAPAALTVEEFEKLVDDVKAWAVKLGIEAGDEEYGELETWMFESDVRDIRQAVGKLREIVG